MTKSVTSMDLANARAVLRASSRTGQPFRVADAASPAAVAEAIAQRARALGLAATVHVDPPQFGGARVLISRAGLHPVRLDVLKGVRTEPNSWASTWPDFLLRGRAGRITGNDLAVADAILKTLASATEQELHAFRTLGAGQAITVISDVVIANRRQSRRPR